MGLQDLGGGLYAWLQPNGAWGESNAGLVVGDGESLLVDTLWDVRLTRRMLDAMGALTAASPIGILVNTHSDPDHWWGNELVASARIVTSRASAEIMATERTSEMTRFAKLGAAMRAAGRLPVRKTDGLGTIGEYVRKVLGPFDFTGITLTPPTETFSGSYTLEVGGVAVELLEVGPAHTPGDLMVHVPSRKTLFAGDILFIDSTPVMWAGPVAGWIAALDRVLELDPDTIVPGHGPLADADAVRRLRGYWTWLDEAARERFAAGMAAAPAARDIARSPEFAQTAFAGWECPERIAINVHALFCEYRGETLRRTPKVTVELFSRAALLASELRRV
jgi:cyclase